MELQLETLQLVRDVVSSADMKVLGHSFIFNEAAARLEESGASSLPAIEHVLIREVMPECPVNLSYIPFPFVGASSVLLCYFRVCKHTGLVSQAVTFLRSLQGTLLIEALRIIKIVWLSHKPTIGIPAELMNVVNEIAKTGSDLEKQVAQFVIVAEAHKDEEPKDYRAALLAHLRKK